jgi:hypothetical protein
MGLARVGALTLEKSIPPKSATFGHFLRARFAMTPFAVPLHGRLRFLGVPVGMLFDALHVVLGCAAESLALTASLGDAL